MVTAYGNGIFTAASEADLQREDEKRAETLKRIETENLRGFEPLLLAQHIKNVWQKNKTARMELDDRLLYCLRARKGEYSPAELQRIVAQGGANPVYLKLTGTKCRAASSWIRDIILPANERPWKIDTTRNPSLPSYAEDVIRQTAAMQVEQMAQEGVQLTPQEMLEFLGRVYDQVETEMRKNATQAAKRVEDKIQDLMDEGDWRLAIEELLEDFVTYPTAFLKGPYYKKKKVLKWEDGVATPVEETVTCWKRVSAFDMYPEPYAKDTQHGDLIERLRLSPSSLFELIGLDGYDEEQIREAVNQYKHGFIQDWIWTDWEREQLLSNNSFFISRPEVIDALHFWGKVQGNMLLEWGIPRSQVPDEDAYYDVDAILVGNYVIRCVINDDPLGKRPYHSACWDAVPGSMWGIALPEQMEDHQKIVNAATRELLYNMAIASGPQAEVSVDRLAEGEDITDIYRGKIWQTRSNLANTTYQPAINFFQPDMNAQTLIGVINTFEQKADDVTNVPRYSYGNEKIGGAGSTASGLSMLLNSAAKGIRRAISHLDANIIQPSVYQSFVQVMRDNPEPALKGDCKIVPKGAAALLIKDSLQNQRKEFLALISNPIDSEIIGPEARISILREFAKELGMEGDLLPSPQEVSQKMANRIPPEILEMKENLQKTEKELQAAQQKLLKDSQDLAQKSLAVQEDKGMLEYEKKAALLNIEAEKAEVEKQRTENELEQDRLDAQKETLQALEQSLRAQTAEKEAELERRLAQSERRITKAEVQAAAARVQSQLSKAEGSKEKKEGDKE